MFFRLGLVAGVCGRDRDRPEANLGSWPRDTLEMPSRSFDGGADEHYGQHLHAPSNRLKTGEVGEVNMGRRPRAYPGLGSRKSA